MLILIMFEKLNFDNFYSFFVSPNEEIPGLQFKIDSQLIPNEEPKSCVREGCDGLMVLRKAQQSMLGKAFVSNKCRKQINWTSGTIFVNSKLPILKFLKLIFCRCMNLSIKNTKELLGVSEKTISIHFKMLRMVSIAAIVGKFFYYSFF